MSVKRALGRQLLLGVGIWAVLVFCAYTAIQAESSQPNPSKGQFTYDFGLERRNFKSEGESPYFPLRPGHYLVLEGVDEGEFVREEITVLNQTAVIDGVETRIVEERETRNGELVELSRIFVALCEQSHALFLFGEDSKQYIDGVIAVNTISWRAGLGGSRAGLVVPSLPLIGARYYQSMAPRISLDRVKVLSVNEELETPMGNFEDCLVTEETSPLEPDETVYKIYAPEVGLVKDGPLEIVRYD